MELRYDLCNKRVVNRKYRIAGNFRMVQNFVISYAPFAYEIKNYENFNTRKFIARGTFDLHGTHRRAMSLQCGYFAMASKWSGLLGLS